MLRIISIFVGIITAAMFLWYSSTSRENLSNIAAPTSEPSLLQMELEHGPGKGTSSQHIDDRQFPNEVFFVSVEMLGTEEKALAEAAGQKIVQTFRDDSFLRWRPVLVPDKFFFMNLVTNDLGTVYEPKELITLTPFPGSTITAKNTYFQSSNLGNLWSGVLTSGGTGTVTIGLTRVGTPEGVEQYVSLTINSDVGSFRIKSTDSNPYYIAMELNSNQARRSMY